METLPYDSLTLGMGAGFALVLTDSVLSTPRGNHERHRRFRSLRNLSLSHC